MSPRSTSESARGGRMPRRRCVTSAELPTNLVAFLREIVPAAPQTGIRLALHPDDPPWPLFGLARVVSTAEDLRAILAACDTLASGLTLRVGASASESR